MRGVQYHVKKEEGEMLAAAARRLASDLDRLGTQMPQRKQEVEPALGSSLHMADEFTEAEFPLVLLPQLGLWRGKLCLFCLSPPRKAKRAAMVIGERLNNRERSGLRGRSRYHDLARRHFQ
jgi:hypothetical protein